MDWLHALFTDENSIAHIVLLYAFVIAVGVLLGKIKFFGVSLGVTFVLFTGIVCGHFGFTGNTQILNFMQDFGLILFVFCIGLQVGPSFFTSFKKGGVSMNVVAVGVVLLNVVVALALYYGLGGRIELPMMVGILCGAVTNTPGLGAANEALSQLSYDGPQIAITQRKGELTESEADLMRKYNTVWGCDLCQSACPYNRDPVKTPIEFFHRDRIQNLTRDTLDAMDKPTFLKRAFAWRGRKTVERNLDIVNKS